MPTITEKYCTGNRRYQAAQTFTPQGVVLHSIGTPQPKASVLWNYWQNNGSQYVVHYMVDDTQILHCMPDNYKCWHVGSPGNAQYLGIEMGEPRQIHYTSGAQFTVSDLASAQQYVKATYKNAVWLIAQLCKKYGWDPYTAVETHYDVTRRGLSNTDHVDPQHLWDGLGMGYSILTLRRDVAAAMGQASASPAPEPEAPTASDQIYRIRKSWADAASQIGAYSNLDYAKAACPNGYTVYDGTGTQVWPVQEFKPYIVRITAQSGLNVRSGPGTGYSIVQSIPYGGGYTIVEEQNGWGLLKAYSQKKNGWISLKYTKRI